MGSSVTSTQRDIDDEQVRRAQQQRLRSLRDELVAEGAQPQRWTETLRARANSWPG